MSNWEIRSPNKKQIYFCLRKYDGEKTNGMRRTLFEEYILEGMNKKEAWKRVMSKVGSQYKRFNIGNVENEKTIQFIKMSYDEKEIAKIDKKIEELRLKLKGGDSNEQL
ncbi:hypothetical protein [Pseudoneobacillus sp. C159]